MNNLWCAAQQTSSCWFKDWYLVCSHTCGGCGWSHGWDSDLFDLDDKDSTLHFCILLRSLSDCWPAKGHSGHVATPECIELHLCEVFVHVSNMVPAIIEMSWISVLFLLQTNWDFAPRQDVPLMLCVNFIWPLSTKNVPVSCGSGCRYENVGLQWALMYTSTGGEGSTCGWRPAEVPRCAALFGPCVVL